mgnify:CR=1 FL=1
MDKSIEAYSARTNSLCPTKEMAHKSVAIIGVGSGGSMVAWWLAATGVGKIILVDFDHLEVANVWRHLCDSDDLGKLKVEAVGAKINRVNPYCQVIALPWDLSEKEDELKLLFHQEAVSLLIVATDTPQSRLLANEMSLDLQIPAVFGSCFADAKAGEVIVSRPHEACYGCIQAAVAAKEPEHETNESFDYSEDSPGEKPQFSAAGLGMSLGLIANLQSHVALWLLRQSNKNPFPLPGNYFLLTSSSFPIIAKEPFSFRKWLVQRRKDCLHCLSQRKSVSLQKRGKRILEALVSREGAL